MLDTETDRNFSSGTPWRTMKCNQHLQQCSKSRDGVHKDVKDINTQQNVNGFIEIGVVTKLEPGTKLSNTAPFKRRF